MKKHYAFSKLTENRFTKILWIVGLAFAFYVLAACTPSGEKNNELQEWPTVTPAANLPNPTQAVPATAYPIFIPAIVQPLPGYPAGEIPTAEPPVSPYPAPGQEVMVEIWVYFTDQNRYAVGTEPYETAVPRMVPASANLPEAMLNAFFAGPTPEEQQIGLVAITSNCTGYDQLAIQDGVARVYLSGPCASNGASYTIAAPLMKSLKQFENIQYVKLYDAEGTEVPDGQSDSIPFSLEP